MKYGIEPIISVHKKQGPDFNPVLESFLSHCSKWSTKYIHLRKRSLFNINKVLSLTSKLTGIRVIHSLSKFIPVVRENEYVKVLGKRKKEKEKDGFIV
jgi:hypothetical protein